MNFSMRFKLASLLAVFGILISGLTGYYSYSSSRTMLLNAAERDLLTATQVLGRSQGRTPRMSRPPYVPNQNSLHTTVPFSSVEEAWFWFIDANQARLDGARFTAARGNIRRPCEPVDILRILDRMYRTRRLCMDHLRVLRFYGVRQMPPEFWRKSEARAATLWREAMRALEPVLIAKGIMKGALERAMESPDMARLWACERERMADAMVTP